MKIKKINSRNYFYLDFISHYKSDSNHDHLFDYSIVFTAVISDSLKVIMILCSPLHVPLIFSHQTSGFLFYFRIAREEFIFLDIYK